MKIKILAIIIIICSLISGAMGSLLLNYFTKEEIKNTNKTSTVNIENSFTQIKNLENNVTKIVKEIAPSVVSIIIKKDLIVYKSDPWGFFKEPVGSIERKIGGGTGFFIKKDGTIITNKHVISDKEATYTVITNDGKEYDSRVLALDPVNDLAIIKISNPENDFEPLKIIKDKQNIKLGQFVVAIGNALAEFQNSISLGVISGKDRIIEVGQNRITGLIQTDAAINPGNSGGPLIDISGNVIGINTAIIDGSEGIGFAIGLTEKKINYIINSIEKNGKIGKPFIGISYISINESTKQQLDTDSDYGAYISLVSDGSNAEKAGINPGDIILEIESTKIKSNKVIDYIIQNKIPGEKIQLKVLKKSGEIKEIEIELGEI